ncbi:MAG: WbqC family protein [Propionivibrio sp.]
MKRSNIVAVNEPGASASKPAQPCVVVSQPMYFPWVGMLEQVRLCNVFVDYNDVQYSKGSFVNRVQIKTASGVQWMTVPLDGAKLGQLIRDVGIDQNRNWQRSHLDLLRNAYAKAPFCGDMLDLVSRVFDYRPRCLGELAFASLQALLNYYPAVGVGCRFADSSTLGIGGASTSRVIDICALFDARSYVTGHGARHYLDHEAFELRGIDVEYVDYGLRPYPQLHGTFTPFVSTLDLIANCGKAGDSYIGGASVPWRKFLARYRG